MASLPESSNGLYALVDMGSNGIRLSITHLDPNPNSTARSLPTVYQDRLGISLYDAQYPANNPSGNKVAIPQDVIDEVILALKKFKVVCEDFGVDDPACVRVLATEATRTAVNSADYRKQIKDATGWEVDLLSKEDEGRIGAMGVASSFDTVEGLVMDLGGGSTQLTYLHTPSMTASQLTSPGSSISFPYGAAALTQRLGALHAQNPPLPQSNYASSITTTSSGNISSSGSSNSSANSNNNPSFQVALQDLRNELLTAFRDAFRNKLQLPSSLAQQANHGGLNLYLSGGGFRGWGFLCLARHKVRPYPIPIINGFTISKRDFLATSEIRDLAAMSLSDSADHSDSPAHGLLDGTTPNAPPHKGIFRISKRRAKQVPAVAFLVECLVEALPGAIKEVRFCQGGVREGWLFERLPEEVRKEDPLVAASRALRPPPSPSHSNAINISSSAATSQEHHIATLLHSTLPAPSTELDRSIPSSLFTYALCQAVANCMYLGNAHPKETRALNALMLPLTGALAGVHGLGHGQRAVLGLILRERWGGDVPEPYGEQSTTTTTRTMMGVVSPVSPSDAAGGGVGSPLTPGQGGMTYTTTIQGLETRLKQLLTPQECWWADYLGRAAALVGEVYPSGIPSSNVQRSGDGRRLSITAKWAEGLGKKGLSQGVKVKLRGREGDVMMGPEAINESVERWEKLGKKKKGWVRGFGVAVRVDVERVGSGEEL